MDVLSVKILTRDGSTSSATPQEKSNSVMKFPMLSLSAKMDAKPAVNIIAATMTTSMPI